MANLNGNELVLYAYNNLEPIGCEETFTLNLTSNEIITTTKGSGRGTNREYGSYDWNIQANGVITIDETGKTNPLHFNDNLIKGKKVAIKAIYGNDFYFGIGIVTSATNTGTSGELAKYDVTISGDGQLYSSNGVKNTEIEPAMYSEYLDVQSSIGSELLYDVTILMVFLNGEYIDTNIENMIHYTYVSDEESETGSITFNTVVEGTVNIYYIPAG